MDAASGLCNMMNGCVWCYFWLLASIVACHHKMIFIYWLTLLALPYPILLLKVYFARVLNP
jgi:hypothetical protein